MTDAVSGLGVGSEFAGYRIEALLGRGGMGAVFLATHLRLGRKAALKVLLPGYADDSSFRERFIRESQLAASLEHPNIVPIYDADERDGILYLAMRYIDGHDLKHRLEQHGPLSPERALGLIEQAAAALDAAHGHGLVHRDVKPANILIGQPGDHVFLTDFGIAKRTSAPGLTQTGTFIGTVDYCAPEQIEGKPVDARTDVYALGCVLFHTLSGQPPYPNDSEVAIIHAHLLEPPPALSTVRPDLPPALDGVIVTAIAKYPDVRYPTCTALSRALREALQAGRQAPATTPRTEPQPTLAAAPQPPRPTPAAPTSSAAATTSRRRPLIAALTALALATIAGAAYAIATALTSDTSTSSPTTPTTQAAAPSFVEAASPRLGSVAAKQRAVTARLDSLQPTRASLTGLETAARALDQAVLRMDGWAEGVTPKGSEAAAVKAVRRALKAHATYASFLANLSPEPRALTRKQAQTALSLAQDAEDAYTRLSGVAPALPSMPIRRSDHQRLISVVLPPTPRTPAPQSPASVTLATFDGSVFSIAYPRSWRIETAEVSKGSYLDTTIRSSDSSSTLLRVDTSPNAPLDLDEGAGPVVRALERQRGYQRLAYRHLTFQDRDALYWEFVVNEKGLTLRKVDLFFVDSAGNGVAILTQAPAAAWSSWSPVFETIRGSFASR